MACIHGVATQNHARASDAHKNNLNRKINTAKIHEYEDPATLVAALLHTMKEYAAIIVSYNEDLTRNQ